MNTIGLVSDVSKHGYELTLAGRNIRYRGKGGLPGDLLNRLRNHKQAVIVYLSAKEKLTIVAEEFEWEFDDLLDWYQYNMKDIARLQISEVRFIVADYIQNHKACRGG